MTRGGRRKDRSAGPERRCIATGAVLPKPALIRFVVGPDGAVVPDIAGRLPGRGMWVRASRAALERAVARGAFARAARQAVTVPSDLVGEVERQLVQRVVSLIALARKSGQAVAGYEKVRAAVTAGRARLLLQACDGSAAQRARIRPPEGANSLISCLSGRELGLAFGRENVIHAALTAGGLCEAIVEDATRLAGVRDQNAPESASAP